MLHTPYQTNTLEDCKHGISIAPKTGAVTLIERNPNKFELITFNVDQYGHVIKKTVCTDLKMTPEASTTYTLESRTNYDKNGVPMSTMYTTLEGKHILLLRDSKFPFVVGRFETIPKGQTTSTTVTYRLLNLNRLHDLSDFEPIRDHRGTPTRTPITFATIEAIKDYYDKNHFNITSAFSQAKTHITLGHGLAQLGITAGILTDTQEIR